MPDHYYTQRPTSLSRLQTIHVSVRGVQLALTTDSGVFSKERLDFGTRLLLETVQLPEEGVFVDLGCGYGVVTCVLARVYPRSRWVMLDVNERAVELARLNATGLAGRAEAFVSDGFAAVPHLRADAVVCNPPVRAGKEVVYRLFCEAKEHLRPGGCLWVVMQKKQGAPSAKSFLSTLFAQVETRERDAGYHVFACTTDPI